MSYSTSGGPLSPLAPLLVVVGVLAASVLVVGLTWADEPGHQVVLKPVTDKNFKQSPGLTPTPPSGTQPKAPKQTRPEKPAPLPKAQQRSGSAPVLATLPDLRGLKLTVTQATSLLMQLGFDPSFSTLHAGTWIVVRTQPAAGKLPVGTGVRLVAHSPPLPAATAAPSESPSPSAPVPDEGSSSTDTSATSSQQPAPRDSSSPEAP